MNSNYSYTYFLVVDAMVDEMADVTVETMDVVDEITDVVDEVVHVLVAEEVVVDDQSHIGQDLLLKLRI